MSSTQRKGIFAETTAKSFLLRDENVLLMLEPLKAYGIVDILVVTKDYKMHCYDVKFDSKRKANNSRIHRLLNRKQKLFAKINKIDFSIIYVAKNGTCHILKQKIVNKKLRKKQ